MKNKSIIMVIFLLTITFSCQKEKISNDFCVNYIFDSPHKALLSDLQLNTIKSLFDSNHLSYTNLQFTYFQTDELGHHHVGCYHYLNNLIVYTDDLIFHFNKDDVYYFLSGDLTNSISLDTKRAMNQNNVIEIYLNEVAKDGFYSKKGIEKGCFDIGFGYYDLNVGRSYTPPLFIKTWKLKPAGKDYPVAYIDDSKHELIAYYNGVIIF